MAERQTGGSSGARRGTGRKPKAEVARPAEEVEGTADVTPPLDADEFRKLLKQMGAMPAEKPRQTGLIWTLLPWIVLVGVLYWVYFMKPAAEPIVPDRDATPSEVAEAQVAVPNKADRAIVHEALTIVADLLEADGRSSKPAITKREQVSEALMAETARSLVLSGVVIADKNAFATLAAKYFDEPSEFPTKAGSLSSEDRVMGVKQIKAFATAFTK